MKKGTAALTTGMVGRVVSTALKAQAIKKGTQFLARGLQRNRRVASPWKSVALVSSVAAAAGAGAAVMYFLDPASGHERRERLFNAANRARLQGEEAAKRLASDVSHRVSGEHSESETTGSGPVIIGAQ